MKIHIPKPKKLKEELTLKEVEIHRKLDCVYYTFCLNYASDFIYESFSCIECLYYYKEEKLSKEQISKLLKLAKEINKE